eukprot:TRINITY_DN905_c0_g1_i3.p1 TRINITY_DN905_c0_g1~~TRINITY_DN905_c0_g1_i3.p1  ORF type:complete len:418 (-),score=24.03 TRINITY_DN905_c0_g1_i3:822-2075(-)
MDKETLKQSVYLTAQKRVLQKAADLLINGKLTKQQCMVKLRVPQFYVDHLFDIYDTNRNGVLDPGEAVQFLQDINDGKAFGACNQCQHVIFEGYKSTQYENYHLCLQCYQGLGNYSPDSFYYMNTQSVLQDTCKDLPIYAGVFLGQEVTDIMQVYDSDKNGSISLQEYLQLKGYGQINEKVQQYFSIAGSYLNKEQLLHVLCLSETFQTCTECGESFMLNMSAYTCASPQCTYYVCQNCLSEKRCNHTCQFLEVAGTLSIKNFGLRLLPDGYFSPYDQKEWAKWEHFMQPYLKKHRRSIIYRNPSFEGDSSQAATNIQQPQVQYPSQVYVSQGVAYQQQQVVQPQFQHVQVLQQQQAQNLYLQQQAQIQIQQEQLRQAQYAQSSSGSGSLGTYLAGCAVEGIVGAVAEACLAGLFGG